jgi:hypothetical protein
MNKLIAIAVIAIFMMPLTVSSTTATANASTQLAPQGQASTGDMNRDHALNNAEQRNMFGVFSYDSGTGNVSGRFLSFIVDKNNGMITNYTIKRDTGSILVFQQVQLSSFYSIGNPRVDGAMFAFNGTDTRIMAHNNPPAILLHRTQGAANNVTYTLASGFVASAIPNSTNVAIEGNGQYALLLIENGTATITGSGITVNLQPWAKSVFRFQPNIGVDAQVDQTLVEEAISSGKLACECSVVAYNGSVEQDFIGYQERLTLRIQEAVQNRLELRVSADYGVGKIIVINVDNNTIRAQTAAEIGLTLDGVRLQQTANVGDIFTAQGTESKFHVVNAEGAFQILIYLGHFSEHSIVVESIGTPAQPSSTILIVGLVAIVALVAVAAMVAIRKRHTA